MVLEVEDLSVVFQSKQGPIHAVNSVRFGLKPGELLGIVGESGAGKSVAMLSLVGLLPTPPSKVSGRFVKFENRNLLDAGDEQLRAVRGAKIGFIFQDPMTSLNPVLTVGFQLAEPLRRHMGLDRSQARRRAAELLDLVGIPDAERRLSDFPHQFSGGMRQRVMIAMALSCEPAILIADEPTTALDVTIQAQILDLMKDLRRKLGTAIIWITHDLAVIAGIADRVAVMYAGQIVEQASVRDLFANPQHPYTKALLETIPAVRGQRPERLRAIAGQPPVLHGPPDACSFSPRYRHSAAQCLQANPARIESAPGHTVACVRVEDGGAPRHV